MLGCPLSAQVSRHATILGDIMKRIATDGCYNLYAKVFDSAKVGGVPQHRVRLYMVGILKSADDKSFEFPDAYDHGGLETILDKKPKKFEAQIPPVTQSTARKNLLAAMNEMMKDFNPTVHPCIVDIDSTKWNWRFNESLCLTKSRGSSGGFYVTNRGRRLTVTEQLRLQAYDPKRINMTCISERQLSQAIGNTMTVSVVERILLRALPAAGLVLSRDLNRRWENVSSAKAQLSRMF